MWGQQNVSAIGVESSHLKLWCGRGSEATAATALCWGEATSHNSWAMSHRLEDLPVLSISLVGKNYCDSGWLSSSLFKIYRYYWKSSASFPFTSEMESRHEICILFFTKKSKNFLFYYIFKEENSFMPVLPNPYFPGKWSPDDWDVHLHRLSNQDVCPDCLW